MKKTTTRLADGRELMYYDSRDDVVRGRPDRRPLTPATSVTEIRTDPLLGEPVGYAAHRQGRTYHPPADQCPLCPTRGDRLTEIPEDAYEVAVFENRFPSFDGETGRCEVVCFTSDHEASFASLTEEQAALVLEAWTDRTRELSRLPGVRQVYCFENRGREIGVTLAHPHGQIYGYPYLTPHTARVLDALARHRERAGGNLFDEVLTAERADGRRVVLETEHWTAFVPHAARWPYEIHLYPRARVPDLLALDGPARGELPGVHLELLRRFDRIFGPDTPPVPYISGWHQAPFGTGLAVPREEFALHLELFTIRRGPDKLKHLAGSESGMRAFVSDVLPEAAAERLREVAT
ncbi:galactose-1-phosphate uridylyltransferase [Streptomyces sp. ACA25]|uniref:galactose-1-phosphate uridylyltransferase n=1 Tax=Streptomyces sp. ACA25 TaxID=3022596 RepID=UPI002307EE90|nr:galactose-1-phosphate uridylyltransferase [Streptomyces sp. ACA25]MDB1087259.1 galactose-1-phosphate uridylyltransferase [Streptomyces sp. ACA25]